MKDIKDKLKEITGRNDKECNIINNILNNHFLIGKNNKEKIIKDFEKELNISYEEADDLYNKCFEVIIKGIFRK